MRRSGLRAERSVGPGLCSWDGRYENRADECVRRYVIRMVA
jgi:hypothetical protein